MQSMQEQGKYIVSCFQSPSFDGLHHIFFGDKVAVVTVSRMDTIDAIHVYREDLVPLLPTEDVISKVIVSREVFEEDLQRSFRSEEDVDRQVRLDAPRCLLYVDGARRWTLPHDLCERWRPLCTQSVVGMAVELLHRSAGVDNPVAEASPPSPLHIRVTTTGDLVVTKALRLMVTDERITVLLRGEDDCVSIEYYHDQKKCPPLL